MKKHRIVSALLIVLLCMSLLTACRGFRRIEESQVERVVVWNHSAERDLTSDETKRFIALYNASKYGGKKIVGESTPNFGIRVYFRDGTVMRTTDELGKLGVEFCDPDWTEITWNYVNSEELYDFASELAEKI